MNIAALLSGGVDSSVVVHLLKEAGHTPTLFYIKIGMDDDELLHCSSEEECCSGVKERFPGFFALIGLTGLWWRWCAEPFFEPVADVCCAFDSCAKIFCR